MDSTDAYSKGNADEAEQLVRDSKAISAKAWLEAEPDNRRIGEYIITHGPHASLDALNGHLALGVQEVWVDAIAMDQHGNSYAQREIWNLPKKKSQRRILFRGLAIRLGLSGVTPLQDIGQDYVLLPLPSAAQVEAVKAQLAGRS